MTRLTIFKLEYPPSNRDNGTAGIILMVVRNFRNPSAPTIVHISIFIFIKNNDHNDK